MACVLFGLQLQVSWCWVILFRLSNLLEPKQVREIDSERLKPRALSPTPVASNPKFG